MGLYQHEMLSKALLTQLWAASACLITEAPRKHVHSAPTVARAPAQGSAEGSECHSGAQIMQCALAPGRAMPLSCPGKLWEVAAPPARLPRHQPGLQLPVQPAPNRRPPRPPYLPAWSRCHPAPRAAAAPPRAAAPPGAPWRRLPRLNPTPGTDTDCGRCLRDGFGRCPAPQRPGGRRLQKPPGLPEPLPRTRPARRGRVEGGEAAPPPCSGPRKRRGGSWAGAGRGSRKRWGRGLYEARAVPASAGSAAGRVVQPRWLHVGCGVGRGCAGRCSAVRQPSAEALIKRVQPPRVSWCSGRLQSVLGWAWHSHQALKNAQQKLSTARGTGSRY